MHVQADRYWKMIRSYCLSQINLKGTLETDKMPITIRGTIKKSGVHMLQGHRNCTLL